MLFSLFYPAIVVSLGAMALLMFMLRRGNAGKVASNFYLIPGVTALIGWLVLGESLTATALAGFTIASAGVWLAHRERPAGNANSGGLWVGWRLPRVTVGMSEFRAFSQP